MATQLKYAVVRAKIDKKSFVYILLLLIVNLKYYLNFLSGFVWVGQGWSGLVWVCMGWYGLVWIGMDWYGLVWVGMSRYHGYDAITKQNLIINANWVGMGSILTTIILTTILNITLNGKTQPGKLIVV